MLADPRTYARSQLTPRFSCDQVQRGLPAAHAAELQAALRVAAAGVTPACKLAAAFACDCRDCRATADSFAAAAERAARAAHPQAMHDMARTLRGIAVPEGLKEDCARALVQWCHIDDALHALSGRVDGGLSGADAWRAFARAFADTDAMPSRIRLARSTAARHRASQLLMNVCGLPSLPPLENTAELNQLAAQDDERLWERQALALLQRA